ncbi:MAG: hypothetical protein PHU71_02150 [Candidatus Gracilibacteria bacterium]|nr:hypothetical protein [Candidatus Gracilibacteria bacterium]
MCVASGHHFQSMIEADTRTPEKSSREKEIEFALTCLGYLYKAVRPVGKLIEGTRDLCSSILNMCSRENDDAFRIR